MSEQLFNEPEGIRTGQGFKEWYQQELARQEQKAREAQLNTPQNYQPAHHDQHLDERVRNVLRDSLSSKIGAEPMTPRQMDRLSDPQKKRMSRKMLLRSGIALAAVVALGGGGAYVLDANGIRTNSVGTFSDNVGTNLETTPNGMLGQKSLEVGQCEDQSSSMMTLTVNGYYPLVPLLYTDENGGKTPTRIEPYMTNENLDNLKSSQQKKMARFVTNDGYNHMTINDLNLFLEVCEPADDSKGNAIVESNGKMTVDRSALDVAFKDASSEDLVIGAAPQLKGADSATVDPEKAQYGSLPVDMYLAPNDTDKAYASSRKALAEAMNTPEQRQILYALVQQKTIDQLDTVVKGQKQAKYPQDADNLQQAIDRALQQRVMGRIGKDHFSGNYDVKAEVPTSGNDKQPITTPDKKTGASPLKYLDADQDFVITSIKVTDGSVSVPTPSPTPTPSASPKKK